MDALQLAEIKTELRVGGLPTHGGAAELTARLAEHCDGWTVAVKDEVNAGTNADVKAEFVHARVKTEPGTEPGLGPWQRAQPRRAVKQPAGPSGAVGNRKRERAHTEPARARRQTGWDRPREAGREAARADAAGTARAGRPERAEEAPPTAAEVDRPKVSKRDASWEAQLAKLKGYMRSHGDCNVPQGWTEDPTLANWVNRQRKYKKKLGRGEPSEGMTAARVAKLEALGFAWELSTTALGKQCSEASRDDAGWEAQLAKLKAYKQKHGECNVPNRWAEDPRLGGWVGTQRKFKKALDRGEPSTGMTAARVAKLDALGFAWELSAAVVCNMRSEGSRDNAGWEAQLAKLKAYMRRHGDCSVPQGWAEDPPLGRWVQKQRTCKKALDRGKPSEGMTAARVAKMEALGFAWELSAAALGKQRSEGNRDDAGWQGWLAKLKAYKREHSDCSVPRGWAEDPPLSRWVCNQRAFKRKLDRGDPIPRITAARVAKLEALGFAWELSRRCACEPAEEQQDA
jgi:hypothetical protein